MKKQFIRLSLILSIIAGSIVSCNDATEAENTTPGEQQLDNAEAQENNAMANITATNQDVQLSGTAIFAQGSNSTKLTLALNIPSKAGQTVAVHIHEHGDCGNMGDHAGGHWNPTGANHGKWGEGSFHSGDIGNIQLDPEGNASFELDSNLWSVGGDEKTDILNKTIIVHDGVDDYTSQPTGNSGGRIGCGVIMKSGSTDFAKK